MAINHVTVRGLVILRQTFVQLRQAAQPTGAPAARGGCARRPCVGGTKSLNEHVAPWCHLSRKSACFPMRRGSAQWCHFSAKNLVISTNGSTCSESSRGSGLRFPPEPLISAPRRPAG